MSAQAVMDLKNVTRRFGQTTVLDTIDVSVPAGSFTALLGASGCGKSTTLRIMAGLDRPSEGMVLVNGESVAGRTAYERNVAMVFQSYALYPHLTVFQNIALPLTMKHLGPVGRLPVAGRFVPGSTAAKNLIRAKVTETAESLGLAELMARKPNSLSGGQKQRVALGRALVRDPVLFLLDEPLSNLDARLRVRMRAELVALHKRTGKPFVYVTHDQAEAMAMADQIIVMIKGKVAQAGSPRELYDRPANRTVAAFVGANSINFFEPEDGFEFSDASSDGIVIGVRPEHLAPADNGPIVARLEAAEFQGSETLLSLRSAQGKTISAIASGDYAVPAPGTEIHLHFRQDKVHCFDRALGTRLPQESMP